MGWPFSGLVAAVVTCQMLAAAAPAGSRYIDSRVCGKCHSAIAAHYAQTGMGRSFFRPARSSVPEVDPIRIDPAKEDFYHALSDTHFSMTLRDGRYYQRRWQVGFAGKESSVEELTVDYVMGSGNHARSYLHRTPRGTLIELPLGWYAENGGRWGVSPGSDSKHPRTRRFISYKCMFCHNGIPQIPAGYDEPDSDPVFAGNLPEGIDCQRCHGPGGKHLQLLESTGSKIEDVRASIINPARLSPKLRMEICMQCHLETSSGRIPSNLVRFDRGPFSFLPGESLDAFMLTFDHAPGTGHDRKFEAVGSVYRLRQSRCFLRSEGKLTCDTCHDPHRVTRGAEAVAHQARICRQCHSIRQGSVGAIDSLIASGKHTGSSDCAGCHMPKRRAEDTPGMIMTDHLIQRRPPTDDLLAALREPPPEEYRGEIVPYYPSPLPRTPENALYLAVAQVGLGNNTQSGLPVLAREIARQKPSNAEFYVVLGKGWQDAGMPGEAVAAYQRAVQLNPKSRKALRSLAAGLSASGQESRAAEALQRALRLAPADPITWYRSGMLDFAMGRASDAAIKVRKAIALDPSLPEQSRSLAEILGKTGQPDAALAALGEALRIDPYDDAAWNLAARLLTEKGEMSEAFYDFQRAIQLRPGYAPHLFDFALALVRADRFAEAQERVEAALSADPKMADAHQLLAGLFARRQQLPEAAREYRRALELRPDWSRVHLQLGNVLAAQGDIAGATEHLRQAAGGKDAGVTSQATQALRQIGVH